MMQPVMDGEESVMDDKLYEAARQEGRDIPPPTDAEFFLRRTPDEESNVLHIASHHGNEGFIKTVMERFPAHHDALLCQQNSKGETPLHLAAQFGHKAATEALLRAHEDSNLSEKKLCWSVRDDKGDTPLHRALRYGHEEIALLLLQKDERLVSCSNNLGESPAYLAADNFCLRFLRTILDQDDASFSGPLGRTVFHPARKLTGDIMSILIEKRKQLLNVQDSMGKTVLHYAIEEKRESIVKILLNAKTSLAYLRDKDGLTPLHRATMLGLPSMVRIILELSPQSLPIRTSQGQTALHVAKMDAPFLTGCLMNTRMKELVNVADNQGNTHLHLAIITSNPDIANTLLEVPDINWRLRNHDGCTPMDLCKSKDEIPSKLELLESAWRGKEVVNMSIFYEKGKDVKNVEDLLDHYTWEECLTYKGHQGNSILHIAARDERMKFIEESCKSNPCRLLLLLGENSKGETPLHVAAEYGRTEAVQFILQLSISTDESGNEKSIIVVENGHGYEQADIKPWRVRSANGDTALHKAVRNGHSEAALCLLSWDPQLASCVNEASESVLYLAAQGCYEVVREILENERYDQYYSVSGPDGKNPLHAVAASPGLSWDEVLRSSTTEYSEFYLVKSVYAYIVTNIPPIYGLLERLLPNLVNKVDNNSKTPLHYAVEQNKVAMVRKLLRVDKSAAFVYDNEGFTPLLRAAANGFDGCVQSILDCCPHSAELHDLMNYRTALHLYKKYNLPTSNLMNNLLLNGTDSDGNTALHCAILDCEIGRAATLMSRTNKNIRIKNNKQQTPYDLSSELMRSGDRNQMSIHDQFKLTRQRSIMGILIKEYIAPVYECMTGYVSLPEELKKFLFGNGSFLEGETEEELKQLLNNMALTATLLVTLSFAAAFTIPGGYDPATGQPLRLKQTSVKVFLGSDALAMLLGIGVLINYTFGITRSPQSLKEVVSLNASLLQLSLLATLMAFTAGIYALASHDAIEIFILAVVFTATIGLLSATHSVPQYV